MIFRVVDIISDSKYSKFVFDNDDTFKLIVVARNATLFHPFALYEIVVTHDVPFFIPGSLHENEFMFLGVVTRKSRQSIHIASGTTHWTFPKSICNFMLGLDVCIHVKLIKE